MSDPLHGLLYRSTATRPFGSRELLPLLTTSQRWNAQHGVTGRLLVEDSESTRSFVQWLEGTSDDVAELFGRIEGDPRHDDLTVLASGPIDELTGRAGRLYPDWSMSLETVDALPESLEAFLAGYDGGPAPPSGQPWRTAG